MIKAYNLKGQHSFGFDRGDPRSDLEENLNLTLSLRYILFRGLWFAERQHLPLVRKNLCLRWHIETTFQKAQA